jgi:hypothetical protein
MSVQPVKPKANIAICGRIKDEIDSAQKTIDFLEAWLEGRLPGPAPTGPERAKAVATSHSLKKLIPVLDAEFRKCEENPAAYAL